MIKKSLLILSFLALVACSSEPTENTETTTSDKSVSTEIETASEIDESVEPETNIQDKTFGITPEEFGNRLSAEIKEVGIGDYDIQGFNIKEGKVNDVFSETLSDSIAMNGVVDKNGELKSVTFIMGQTDNVQNDIVNLSILSGLTARALTPGLPKEETAGELVKLMNKSINDFGEKGEGNNSKVIEDVKYTVSVDKMTGLWIIFEPAE